MFFVLAWTVHTGGTAEEGSPAWASDWAAQRLPACDCWAGGGAGGSDRAAGGDWKGEHTTTPIHGEDAGGDGAQLVVILSKSLLFEEKKSLLV